MSQINVERIKKNIDKYNVVSFDIFDTLLKRNVNRTHDIFLYVEKEYNKIHNNKIENFKEKRIVAEFEAREKKHSYSGEVTIEEIYTELKNKNTDLNIDINDLISIETKLEVAFCQINYDFLPIYNYAIEKKKKIIIISDMYLPKNTIESMLKKIGINKYYKLYLSNELGLNKRYGKIYEYVINDLKIKNNEIIHIGDSKRNDFIMPRINGIKSIKIPTEIKKTRYKDDKYNDLTYNSLTKFINNNLNKEDNIYFRIGYETLGCLLYGFCLWLNKNLREKNIKKIYFLSREGNLLKKAFGLINSDIEAKYLYVSRRSTRVALLKNANTIEDVIKIIKPRRTITIEDFIKSVGLNPQNYKEIAKELNLQFDKNINDLSNFNAFFDKIVEDIRKENNEKEKILVKYLKQEDFNENIAIVDVGWVGTMQCSLYELCKENKIEVNINGFYIGKSDQQNKIENFNNFLFNKDSIYEYNMIHSFLNLFESFFLAQHGTTIGYKKDKELVVPILDNYEYKKDEMEVFINIQNGAIKFIRDFKNSNLDKYINIDYKVAFRNILTLGTKPTLKDVSLFSNIKYVETASSKFIEAKNLLYYLFNLKAMYNDFSNTRWKIGFLKYIFKVKVNYYKIYSKLLNIDKRRKT